MSENQSNAPSTGKRPPPMYSMTPPTDAELIEAANTAVATEIERHVDEIGGPWQLPDDEVDAVGRTAFDSPSSEDGTVTVLLPKESIGRVPSQSLLRIESKEDGRTYRAVVVEGPFSEPDGLRPDAPVVVTTTVRGGFFLPRYHGRIHAELMGEVVDGTLEPPRFRPLPNSPAFVLGSAETTEALKLGGKLRIGRAVGHDDVVVAVPADSKEVLPRHTAVLGTTGGGKSTTIAGLVGRLQSAGAATVIFDTEGEYTALNQPTEDARMVALLARAGIEPSGVRGTDVYHLVGRETRNPDHPRVGSFGLRFEALAPEAVTEILELNEAQKERYLWAYDAAKRFVDQAGLLSAEERAALVDLDELERGYPRLTLALLYDVVAAIAAKVGKEPAPSSPRSETAASRPELLAAAIEQEGRPGNKASWLAVQGRLGRILRLKIFDRPDAAIDYEKLVQPGRVAIVDLSDTDSPTINNLVIADLLRGIQAVQEERYEAARKEGTTPKPTVVIVEEAHEFLSAERIRQMPVLFQQVARIARRGRKRWLGLVFVTQLPQHLPDEVFGLVNNYVLHKIADPNVVERLRKTIGGIDKSLWTRVPTLAPGQAIVSMGGMARPLLTAVDPAGARLMMAE